MIEISMTCPDAGIFSRAMDLIRELKLDCRVQQGPSDVMIEGPRQLQIRGTQEKLQFFKQLLEFKQTQASLEQDKLVTMLERCLQISP